MFIEIKNDSTSAVIDTLGAQLVSLKDSMGEEYIWQRDPRFWSKCSPVLFPVVGNSRNGRTMFDGQWYELCQHGFAKDMEFCVEKQSEGEVSFTLIATPKTRVAYPFDFRLTMTYGVMAQGLTVDYEVTNEGTNPMYYCLGAHPAFNCPMGDGEQFEDYCLEFEREENCHAICYDLDTLEFDATSRGYYLDHTKRVPLRYELFDHDALCFQNLESQKVSLVHSRTKKGVEVTFGDFKTIAFWTPIGKRAPFLCIEPWNGSAIWSDEDDEFIHRRHVQRLDRGEKKKYCLEIRFLMGKE